MRECKGATVHACALLCWIGCYLSLLQLFRHCEVDEHTAEETHSRIGWRMPSCCATSMQNVVRSAFASKTSLTSCQDCRCCEEDAILNTVGVRTKKLRQCQVRLVGRQCTYFGNDNNRKRIGVKPRINGSEADNLVPFLRLKVQARLFVRRTMHAVD
jgi:hypothetical protein